jgi:uncharacterized membrane protein YeaQ/YmgE (transglycosylase-associated protein family)/uncharacterized protein YjbJ (UPF0337 family)
MNYIIWLIAGAGLGWLTTIIIRNRRMALLFNVVVGMVGAFLAGFLLVPMFHLKTSSQGVFSLPALLVSLIGAVILLAVINFFRRDSIVKNDVIERKWEQIRNKMQTRWGKLTDQDISKINSHHDQFIVTLQERYGNTKEEVEDQIQRYLKAILAK